MAAVAIGPIFWLLPSKRDKRVAEFRRLARGAGLVVELAAIPDLHADAAQRVSAGGVPRDPKIACAAYRLPFARPLQAAPRWQLLKSADASDPLPGWIALEPHANVPAPPAAAVYWQRLRAITDVLPGDCVGVQADAGTIAWFGRERTDGDAVADAVEGIRAGLEAIGILHDELNGALLADD